MNKTAVAFAPAGISSFFEICDKNSENKPITHFEKVGAVGGGFGLKRGVLTEVEASPASANEIEVFINGLVSPEAQTTKTVLNMLLEKVDGFHEIRVKHHIEVPIGAGFGTSAGGALTAGLALKEVLGLSLTYNQIGKIAHVAEIICHTGLGTVGPLMVGGCVLTVKPGAPGIGIIDRIPINPDYRVITGFVKCIPTREILLSDDKREKINRNGSKTLKEILSKPCLENFLACCWRFAQDSDLATPTVLKLVELAKKAGAVGAAQNMLGEAVHAVAYKQEAFDVAEAFKLVLPEKNVLVSEIDFQGARLMSET